MGHYIGQLETTTAAQRPSSFIQATAINNNGSFLDNWEQLRPRSGRLFFWTIGNYGRAAAAFLKLSNFNYYWVFFGELETTTAAKLLFFIGLLKQQLRPRSGRIIILQFGTTVAGRLLELGNCWHQKMGHYIGQLQLQKLGNVTTSFRSKNILNSHSFCTTTQNQPILHKITTVVKRSPLA